MLNRPQISILKFLSACNDGSASYTALFDKFGPSVNFNLASLVMSGDVSCAAVPQFVPDEVFFITSKGHQALDDARRRALLAHKKRTQQEAKQDLKDQLEDKRWRKDARRSWVQWAITTVISLMSFFTGAIVEMFTGFMEWVLALFH